VLQVIRFTCEGQAALHDAFGAARAWHARHWAMTHPLVAEVQRRELQQRFCQACKDGDIACVERLLLQREMPALPQSQPQPQQQQQQPPQPQPGGVDVEAEAPVAYHDAVWSDRPLGHATSAGAHLGVMACLLRHGAPVDGVSSYGSTALHVAAQEGALDAVQLLVASGASITRRGRDGKDAIDWTAGEIYEAYDGPADARAETARWLRAAVARGAT